MTSLLPPNARDAELALEASTGRIDAIPVPIADAWSVDRCPTAMLPWLAWALSVDVWDDRWSEDTKREVIRQSAAVHRRKGTVASVKAALKAAGYGDADLIERYATNRHDGSFLHDGSRSYARVDHWAEYRVVLASRITNEQAAVVRRILGKVAPVRSHLKALDFRQARILHDGSARHDATYNYGIA